MTDVFDRLEVALADRYALERELGRGGMATVYLAKELKHPRSVAIKVLDPAIASGVGPERFLREIDIAARLQHPNVLPLFDSGVSDGLLYYVMPYIEGGSLANRIHREGDLPLEDVLQIGREVADGLGYVHEQGVVHRDIKPASILLSRGRPVIADFGIARAIAEAGRTRVTETGRNVRTPSYMSPEQASGEYVDARSDIYSLGCVLYDAGRRAAVHRAHRTRRDRPASGGGSAGPRCSPAGGAGGAKRGRGDGAGEVSRRPHLKGVGVKHGAGGVGRPPGSCAAFHAHAADAIRAAALALVGVAAIAYTGMRLKNAGPESALVPERIAVLPLANRTGAGEHDEFGRYVAEHIADGLAQAGLFQVVSMRSVDMGLGESNSGDQLRDLADYTGSGILITGSFYQRSDSLDFHVDVLDAQPRTPAPLYAIQPAGAPMSDAMHAVECVKERAAATLAQHFEAEWPEHISSPPSLEGYLEYMKGNRAAGRLDWEQANVHYYRALELDSTYLSPVLALVSTLTETGNAADGATQIRC